MPDEERVSDNSSSEKEVLGEARQFVEQTSEALSGAHNVSEDVRSQLQRRLNELRHRIEDGESEAVAEKLEETRAFIDQHVDLRQKSPMREYAESIGLAIIFALFLRGFVIEAFKIPTGSMIPTLLIGDHLFVNKFIYGVRVPFTETYLTRFSRPSKGEVVVFTFPTREAADYIAKQPPSRRDCIKSLEEKDFIKRIVGIEGDTVALEDNHLRVNGSKVEGQVVGKKRTNEFLHPHEIYQKERLGGHRYTSQYTGRDRDFGPVKVRDDHVFVMGDNRDNSSDSRCWGQVPIENIKGRAMFIWWSIGAEDFRFNRIGKVIQ
jgi:signal peptidase I